MLTSHRFSCSLGTISLYFEDEALIGLDLEGSAGCGERLMAQLARHGIDPTAFRPEATPAALAVEQWLTNYAAGSRDPFTLPRKLYGTPFQISVWNALEALGYDEVISYAELARRVGSNGYRAVGTAVGHNPIPIIPVTALCGRTASSGDSAPGTALRPSGSSCAWKDTATDAGKGTQQPAAGSAGRCRPDTDPGGSGSAHVPDRLFQV